MFDPTAVLFVGIAGGLRPDHELGAVVVATKVYGIHGGRDERDGFHVRPEAWKPRRELVQLAQHLDQQRIWQGLLVEPWRSTPPTVYFGATAAGEVVLNNPESPLIELLRHYNDAIAIDTEDHGFAEAMGLHPHVAGLVIRGISDLAGWLDKNTTDGKGWRASAAAHAGGYAVAVALQYAMENRHRGFQPLEPPLMAVKAPDATLDPPECLTVSYRASLALPEPALWTRWRNPQALNPASALTLGLPRADRHFVGRERELRHMRALMLDRADLVCVISGMAGVGKTALATRVAAEVTDIYPDGCLFLDLRGYSLGRRPRDPTEVLDRFLRRLGLPGEAIPTDVDERAALLRSALADRRMLVVLDNAHDSAQVRPLLPAASGCGVLVTSRSRLAALDDAVPVSLGLLETSQAAELFRNVVGPERLGSGSDADCMIARIVRRCGRLPLAVRIVAARHRVRDAHALSDLDSDLSEAGSPLAVLDDGERSVVASLTVSVSDLPTDAQRALAMLAVHPGVDVELHAAAALLGEPLTATARHLDVLVDRHLLVEDNHARYRFHDLVASFTREHVHTSIEPSDRDAALRRLLDFYVRAVDAADTVVTPHRFRVGLDLIDTSSPLPRLDRYDDALAWLSAEQTNTTEACLAAHTAGLDVSCWQLALALRGYFFLTKC